VIVPWLDPDLSLIAVFGVAGLGLLAGAVGFRAGHLVGHRRGRRRGERTGYDLGYTAGRIAAEAAARQATGAYVARTRGLWRARGREEGVAMVRRFEVFRRLHAARAEDSDDAEAVE
jgi:hypothetical protein